MTHTDIAIARIVREIKDAARIALDDLTAQLHEVQARLGTDNEQPGDLDLAQDLAHAVANARAKLAFVYPSPKCEYRSDAA